MANVRTEPACLDSEYNARIRMLADGERRVREALHEENSSMPNWRLRAIVNRARKR